MPTVAELMRALPILFVAMLAPRRMLARVRSLDRVGLWLLARGLARAHARGEKLRYPGESFATVAARIDLEVWLSHDPHRALRHLARQARGHRRARLGRAAPPTFAPARLWFAPVVAPDAAVAFADSS